jgi:hypothetical protein
MMIWMRGNSVGGNSKSRQIKICNASGGKNCAACGGSSGNYHSVGVVLMNNIGTVSPMNAICCWGSPHTRITFLD